MRLICPNCGAQYEVADDAIPPSGRDVQCSNCGHAWFQHPALNEMDEAEVVASGTPSSDPEPTPEPQPQPAETPAPAEPSPAPAADATQALPEADPESSSEPAPAIAPAPTETAVAAALGATPQPAQRSIDDSLLAVLREEAEREVAQRRAEAARGIETQSELGIDAAMAAVPRPPPPAEAPRRGASKQDFSYLSSDADLDTTLPEASVRPAARRDLLPDVEVISSTLRSSSAASDDDNPMPDLPPIRRSGGFRSGFLLSVLLAVIVVVAYVMAPGLAEQFPAAKGALDAYVAAIDALRLWVGTMVASLNGMLESQG
ncbi:MAG: zinc-ribbon domain-containing protein [Pseudomonadota bacterium]